MNGRCRLHGGLSRGGSALGRYRGGLYTREMRAARRPLADHLRACARTLKTLTMNHETPNDGQNTTI